SVDELIFEAPTKASQAWFVKQFGPNVNLGNIPPEEVIPLETLRLGLRGDTLREVPLGGEPARATCDRLRGDAGGGRAPLRIRKVEPLERALAPYSASISGIRRDQSPSRAATPKLQWSERYGVWKVHPLADWSEKRVWGYITVNEIPFNPLHEAGYRSIGCI